MRSLAWLPLALLCAACPSVKNALGPAGAAAPPPPRITVAGVTLVKAPSARALAQALCPRVAPNAVCYMLGGVPSFDDLRFVFDVALEAKNQAQVPLPVVEALTAFTVFPASSGAQNLGTVCLKMCEAGTPSCQPDPNGCRNDAGNVRTTADYTAAAANFVVSYALGKESLDNLTIKTIPVGGTVHVTFRLALDPQAMLGVLTELAQSAMDQIKRASTPQFVIPYRVEGSVWVNVEHFGKIGAGYGPYDGEWLVR